MKEYARADLDASSIALHPYNLYVEFDSCFYFSSNCPITILFSNTDLQNYVLFRKYS